jgi:MSHA pilin protein MshC
MSPRPRCPPNRGPRRRLRIRQAGFTLVELVIVMLLMGVLAALGMSRFADREPFAAQGVADQLTSGLRVTQAMAVAQRRVIYVAIASTPPVLSVCLDAACTQPLTTPAGDALWLSDTTGLHLNAAASFSFGGDGVPSLASSLALQVLADSGTASSQTITVEAGSGYVH